LVAFLRKHDRVALDTSVFVYHLEAHPKYGPLTRLIFAWLEQPGHRAVTSTLTMTELLVKPYREGDQQGVDACFALFLMFPNLEWVPLSLHISDEAARIRTQSRLKAPDAIEAATAIYSGISGFLTNDTAYQRVSKLDTLLLDAAL
jgi:predicted nucleic acid-binding protein